MTAVKNISTKFHIKYLEIFIENKEKKIEILSYGSLNLSELL